MTKVLICALLSSQPGSAAAPGALRGGEQQPPPWVGEASPVTARGFRAAEASPSAPPAVISVTMFPPLLLLLFSSHGGSF